VPDTVVSGEWKVVSQKEARSRHVVVKVVELSLGAHSVAKEKNLIEEGLGAFHDGNVLSKKLGEEVFTTKVQQVNASLAQPQNNDSKLEEED